MPALSSSSSSSEDENHPPIRRLSFTTPAPGSTQRPARPSTSSRRNLLDPDVDLFSEAAGGIYERDRARMRREVRRWMSLGCAVLSCLCAGSITTFSLYAPRFASSLHYSQLQINAISISAELGLYLLVPLFGFLCDRYSPAPLSIGSSALFGSGYFLAAYTFRAGHGGAVEDVGGDGDTTEDGRGPPYTLMMLAFVLIGAGTACMYLSGVATCAKNFRTSRHRGLVLALPIAAFGLSGMWLSQVGAGVLYERLEDGGKGDVDVVRYFVFLGILLIVVGLLGALGLRIVDEQDLIEAGIENLEASGLLEDSEVFCASPGPLPQQRQPNYGTLSPHSSSPLSSPSLRPHRAQRKTYLLNHATRLFLRDRTMWLLAAGFFLVAGAGESYINNVGSIVPTLTPPHWPTTEDPPAGSPATHVSIIAVTSTLARILTGLLADLFTPSPSLSPASPTEPTKTPPPRLSRLTLLLPSVAIQSLAFLLLLLPPPPYLLPTSSALLGVGYGACFSLVPLIISVVWGVENFATNWGVVAMMPAGGATVAGVLFGVGFREGCSGMGCWGPWAGGCAAGLAVAGGLWAWAGWRWRRDGVVV